MPAPVWEVCVKAGKQAYIPGLCLQTAARQSLSSSYACAMTTFIHVLREVTGVKHYGSWTPTDGIHQQAPGLDELEDVCRKRRGRFAGPQTGLQVTDIQQRG